MGPRGAKVEQDGPTEVTNTVQDGAKMGQDAAKTRESESNKCGLSRQICSCFAKLEQFRGKEGPSMYV